MLIKMKFKYTYKVFNIIQSILMALTVYNLILWIMSHLSSVGFPDTHNIPFIMNFDDMTFLFFVAFGINSCLIPILKD